MMRSATGTDAPARDEIDDRAHHRALGRVGVGLPRKTLDLDVDHHSRARFQRLGERRDLGVRGTQRRERLLDDDPEPFDVRIVVHDQLAVGGAPGVELHPVRAELARFREGDEGVLGPGERRTPVTQHERTIDHGHPAYGLREREHVPLRDAKVLVRPLAAPTPVP